MDKYFYNEASAAKLGWDPTWFGCNKFNDELIEAIEKYQKSRGLTDDGLCGPSTYRRVYTDRQESIESFRPNEKNNKDSFIIYNSE
jgi:murein L,D-transpeptidase YcbB/YkuD